MALNFINKAGIPFRLLSDIKQDRYMVVGKTFKLKTIIKRPDLHQHITYRAEDPTGKNSILLFGDSSLTLLPQHSCDEFVPVEVTSKPGDLKSSLRHKMSIFLSCSATVLSHTRPSRPLDTNET